MSIAGPEDTARIVVPPSAPAPAPWDALELEIDRINRDLVALEIATILGVPKPTPDQLAHMRSAIGRYATDSSSEALVLVSARTRRTLRVVAAAAAAAAIAGAEIVRAVMEASS